MLRARTIAPYLYGEESLDSTGQPTGEEPGFAKAETESATENNCHAGQPAGEGENVR